MTEILLNPSNFNNPVFALEYAQSLCMKILRDFRSMNFIGRDVRDMNLHLEVVAICDKYHLNANYGFVYYVCEIFSQIDPNRELLYFNQPHFFEYIMLQHGNFLAAHDELDHFYQALLLADEFLDDPMCLKDLPDYVFDSTMIKLMHDVELNPGPETDILTFHSLSDEDFSNEYSRVILDKVVQDLLLIDFDDRDEEDMALHLEIVAVLDKYHVTVDYVFILNIAMLFPDVVRGAPLHSICNSFVFEFLTSHVDFLSRHDDLGEHFYRTLLYALDIVDDPMCLQEICEYLFDPTMLKLMHDVELNPGPSIFNKSNLVKTKLINKFAHKKKIPKEKARTLNLTKLTKFKSVRHESQLINPQENESFWAQKCDTEEEILHQEPEFSSKQYGWISSLRILMYQNRLPFKPICPQDVKTVKLLLPFPHPQLFDWDDEFEEETERYYFLHQWINKYYKLSARKVRAMKAQSYIEPEFPKINREFNDYNCKLRHVSKRVTKLEQKVDKIEAAAMSNDSTSVNFVDPMSEILSNMVKEFEKTIIKAESNGDVKVAVDMKEALKLIYPMKPQMFSNLFGDINVSVTDETKEWASTTLESFTSTMSDLKIKHGIDEVTRDSLAFTAFTTIGGALLLWTGLTLIKSTTPVVAQITLGITACLGIYIAYNYYGTYFCECYDKLVALIPSVETPAMRPQSLDTIDCGSISTILCGAVYYSIFTKVPDDKLIKVFIKECSGFSKFKTGLTDALTSIIDLTKSFIGWLANATNWNTLHYFCSANNELVDISIKLNELVSNLRMGGEYNYENASLLFNYETRLRSILTSIKPTRENQGEIHSIEQMLRTVSNLTPLFVGYVKNGPRVAPLCVLIVGPSNVGKSVNYSALISSIAAGVLSDSEWDSFRSNPDDAVFSWQSEAEFFEGFHGQPFWAMDEVMQTVDAPAHPDPGVFGLIRANNAMPFILNMAACEAKGNMFAKPKVILGTSNIKVSQVKSIHEPEAYNRRWEVVFLQVPKIQYCTDLTMKENLDKDTIWARRLDVSKLPPNKEELDYDICDFFRYNIATGEVINTTPYHFYADPVDGQIYINSIVDYIVNKYKNKHEFGKKVLSSNKALIERLSARRKMHPQMFGWNHKVANFFKNINPNMPKVEAIKLMELYMRTEDALSRDFKEGFVRCYPDFEEGQREYEKFVRDVNCKCDQVEIAIRTLYDFLSNKKVLAAVGTALTIAGTIWFFSKATFVPQSGTTTTVKSKSVVTSRSRTSSMRKQSCVISQNLSDIMNVVYKNSVYRLTLNDTASTMGFVLFISGRVGVMPKHYYDRIVGFHFKNNKDLVLRFTRVATDTYFEVNFSDMYRSEEDSEFVTWNEDAEDTIWFHIPHNICYMHKSILKFLPSEKDLFYSHNFYASLLRVGIDHKILPSQSLMVKPLTEVGPDDDYGYNFTTAFRYNIDTKDGECGSPLFTADSHAPMPRLIGFHTAGDGKAGGLSMPIWAESAQSSLTYFSEVAHDEISILASIKDVLTSQSGDKLDTFVPLTLDSTLLTPSIPPKFNVLGFSRPMKTADKTQLVRGRLYGCMGPVNKFPAKLRPFMKDGLLIHPGYNARMKYNMNCVALSEDLLIRAEIATCVHVLNCNQGEEDRPIPRVWGFKEAVEGNVEFNSLTMSSSTGYPFGFQCKKKKDFFISNGEVNFSKVNSILLEKHVLDLTEKLASNQPVEIYFLDFLKDETLKLEKVEIGKSRMISCESVACSIITRQYFGDFMLECYKSKIFNGLAIGINPCSYDWTLLAKYLNQVGDNMIAGDFASYDGCFQTRIFYHILRIVESYYTNSTDRERNIRRRLIECVCNSYHVTSEFLNSVDSESPAEFRAVVYEWHGGMPSGFTLTALFGSIGGLIIVRYAIYACLLDVPHYTYKYFMQPRLDFVTIEKNIKLIQGGDDNIISLGKVLVDNFVDQKALTLKFSEMGWTYTDETKTGLIHETRALAQINFYKRMFVWYPQLGRFLAPLDFESIDDRINYIKNTAQIGDYERNIRSAVLEYSAHGRSVYELRALPLIKKAGEVLSYYDFPGNWEMAVDEFMKLDCYTKC